MGEQDIPVTNFDLSHHLQRQIIMKLRQDGDQSYQGLKPDGVEGNAFNYHLRQLKQLKLIDGSAKSYTLTPRGHLVADGFSSPAARLMMRPYAHTSVLVTSGGKVLLYKATRQPLQGIYTIPSGKMRYGDDQATSIGRELERRGIHDDYAARVLCATNFRYTLSGEVSRNDMACRLQRRVAAAPNAQWRQRLVRPGYFGGAASAISRGHVGSGATRCRVVYAY